MMQKLTDFHSHILPGIDDGSDSVETSLAMLRMQAEQGIRRVIATPHFYPRYDSPEEFLDRRDRAEELLRQASAGQPDLPEVIVGAEVYFFRGMSQSELLSRLTIQKKHCILIEMPPAPWPEDVYSELERIRADRGITPVIAHIDRYIRPFRTFGIPQRLEELPVLVQANGDFFLKGSTSAMALGMLKAGQIHLLGSDCHNLSDRKPNLGPAGERITRKLGENVQSRICEYEDFALRKE